MNTDKEEFKHLIYDLVRGTRNIVEYPVKESAEVIDEFEEGMYCSKAYEDVYYANQRLCERLCKEDEDVECIFSNLLNIGEYLSMKMYDYGEFYAQKFVDSNVDEFIEFYSDLTTENKTMFMNFLYSLEKLMKGI